MTGPLRTGMFSLVCVGVLGGVAFGAGGGGDDRFVGMHELLRGVRSMAMDATIEMRIYRADALLDECGADASGDGRGAGGNDVPRLVRGSMSYVVRDGLYRYSVDLPASDLPAIRTELAFDGEAFTYIDHGGRLADQTRGVDRGLQGLILSLPIFAGYEMIEPQHDLRPTIPHLLNLRGRVEAGLVPSFERWVAADADGLPMLASRAIYEPGELPEGMEFRVFVHGDEPERPARIEYWSADSEHAEVVTEIRHYAEIEHGDGSVSEWPLFVSHTAFCSDGRRVFDLSFVVRSLMINDGRINRMAITPAIPPGYVHSVDGGFVVDRATADAARHAERWDAVRAGLDAEDDAAVVQAFLALAGVRTERGMLIVTQTEAEFVASLLGRTEAEQEPLYQTLMDAASVLRRASRLVIARGDALRDAGDLAEARSHYEAVRRVGAAHASEDVVLLMQTVGRALQAGATERLGELDAPPP